MADSMNELITEAKKNKYSLIPTLSENDVLSVWEAASGFIEDQMLQQKGVTIQGLGTFTFSQKKIDVGSNKFIIIQRPVFVLSDKFAQTHSLQYIKQHTSGQIPMVSLNFTVLSNKTPFDRDTVELCVKEVLQALGRSLAAKKNIHFDFGNIGRLIIHEGRAKMRFFREFIASLDTSGEMESAFHPDSTRAQSELSIMSNPSTPRPSTTTSILTLPRIVEPSGNNMLTLECTTTPPRSAATISVSTPLPSRRSHTPSKIPRIVEDAEEELDGDATQISNGDTKWSSGLQDERSVSHSLVPKPVGFFASTPSRDQLLLPRVGSSHHGGSSAPSSRVGKRNVKTPREYKNTSSSAPETPRLSVRPSTCSHLTPVGQELCYLCHQRALRNIPIDVSQERREKEQGEDKLLQEYQHQRDLLALAREQATRNRNCQYNREIASFNLDAAKKKIPRKSSEFYPSYVFQQRALTPAKHLKQHAYCGQLDEQVEHKQARLTEACKGEARLEREEQLRLAKELGIYQEAYVQEKAASVSEYQKALAEQVAIKHELSSIWSRLSPTPSSTSTSHPISHSSTIPAIPSSSSHASGKLRPLSLPKPTIILPFSHTKTMTILKDGKMKMIRLKPTSQTPMSEGTDSTQQQPVFGVHDVSAEKQQEEKERARAHFLEQLRMVSEKQGRVREKAMKDQQEEAEMLKKTRQSLLSDLQTEKKWKWDTRQSLEEAWDQNIQEKQCHLAGELQYARDPSILLHQQCEKYVRCKQCQRCRGNVGKSNLLSESRYISGARLIV